mgnify:CR=1 FL=1
MLDVNTYDTINLLEDLEKEKVSARQALETCLSRISEHNNQINQFKLIKI